MKLQKILLISFLLVTLTNFSQVTSPSISIIEKDTIWPASNEEINLSNNIVNDLDACVDLLQNKDSTITEYEGVIKKATVTIGEQDEQILNLTNQVNLEADMLEACEKSQKKKDRKIKFLKFTRNIAICIAGLEACYIGFQILINK